jgi:hypothetical protein
LSAYVVVQLAPGRGKQPRGGEGAFSRGDVKRLLAEHDAVLMRDAGGGGGESDTRTLAVPDMDRADKLAAALRDTKGIATAYAKPAEELP